VERGLFIQTLVAGFMLGRAIGLRLLLLLLNRCGGSWCDGSWCDSSWRRRLINDIGQGVPFGLFGQPAVGIRHMFPFRVETRVGILPCPGVALRRQTPITFCGSHSRLPPCHMT